MTSTRMDRWRGAVAAGFGIATNRLRRRQPDGADRADTDEHDGDPVEMERRRRERAEFDDDASYFDFLVRRAVGSGSDRSPETDA